MTFAVEDFREFAHILYEHPEWREELRRLTLTDDILELPELCASWPNPNASWRNLCAS